jgi:ubiquinone biosynthesis protein
MKAELHLSPGLEFQAADVFGPSSASGSAATPEIARRERSRPKPAAGRKLGSLRRFGQLLRVFSRHALLQLAATRLPFLRRWLPLAESSAPERLRHLFEDLGGTFVKFGQMLALQPDILPIEFCNALFKLLDRVEPFSYEEVERIIREELGDSPERIFDRFERQPLATASVGQVHVAWYQGAKVAVKVQRPNVGAEFWSDIQMMLATMKFIRWLHLRPLYFMLEPITEFVGWTQEELDYNFEAHYSEELRRLAKGNPGQYVPKVYSALTTRRTLVVEFLNGVTLLDYLRAYERGDEVLLHRLALRGFDRTRFAANVIDNFLGDCFRHGIYHADLHPANLMILDDSVVGYIDFGITGAMSPYSRRHLMAMTLALAQGDTENLICEFLALSTISPSSDPVGLQRELTALLAEWYDERGGQRLLRVSFTRVCRDFLAVSRRTGVLPERDIVKYIRSAIAIDGLCSRFEPDFHIGQRLATVCAQQIKRQHLAAAFSHEQLLGRLETGRRLLTDGPARAFGLFNRLALGEIPIKATIESAPSGSGSSGEIATLGAMVLLFAVLLTVADPASGWGLNLFTAEALVLTFSLARLFVVVTRES